MRQIEIDIDIHRAIEANRLSFDEEPKDILRRMLGISGSTVRSNLVSEPRERLSRTRANYVSMVSEIEISGGSLKDILRKVILAVDSKQSGFIERLAGHRTTRGRRIVARKPEELYPGKPDLVEKCAERLNQHWWFDTNVSFSQTVKYLDIISQFAHMKQSISLTRK